MSFLDVNVMHQGQPKFDWDDINVGNTQLDHSQNFFAKKHYKHERLDEMELLQQKMIKSNISAIKNEPVFDKENIANSSSGEKPNDESKAFQCIKQIKRESEVSPIDTKNKMQAGEGLCTKVTTNLASEWSAKKPICSKSNGSKGAVLKTMLPPPQAYLVKDVYKRKREEAERRRAEEERKLREFHSRPAPSFKNQDQLQKRKPLHAVTVAVTPQVLKKSREAEEKRRIKLEEWKLKNQPPKFEPRQPTVLKEKPFIPEKKPTVVQQRPFNLHMEKRLQERKQYNETKQKALEEKQKQVEIEEEERRRAEKEHIKELRKATTFKARPNPFRN